MLHHEMGDILYGAAKKSKKEKEVSTLFEAVLPACQKQWVGGWWGGGGGRHLGPSCNILRSSDLSEAQVSCSDTRQNNPSVSKNFRLCGGTAMIISLQSESPEPHALQAEAEDTAQRCTRESTLGF